MLDERDVSLMQARVAAAGEGGVWAATRRRSSRSRRSSRRRRRVEGGGFLSACMHPGTHSRMRRADMGNVVMDPPRLAGKRGRRGGRTRHRPDS